MRDRLNRLFHKFNLSFKFKYDELPAADRNKLLFNSKSVQIKRKFVVFQEGDEVQNVYLLKKGILKVYQTNFNGDVQILFFYKQGDFFGYRPLFSESIYPVSVSALEDCELLVFDKKIFMEIANNSIDLCKQLLRGFSNEFSVFSHRLNMFSHGGKKARLAISLLLLNSIFSNTNETDPLNPAEIKLTRTDLANFVGTSLENLIRMMNGFKEKKLIKVVGKSIFILDFPGIYSLTSME